MEQIVLIFHILIAIALIALVLIQRGKGADMGVAFGSGASSTVFGSRGSSGFLMKLTMVLAALFFATSISLTYMASRQIHVHKNQNFLTQVEQLSKKAKQAPPKTQKMKHILPAKRKHRRIN